MDGVLGSAQITSSASSTIPNFTRCFTSPPPLSILELFRSLDLVEVRLVTSSYLYVYIRDRNMIQLQYQCSDKITVKTSKNKNSLRTKKLLI